MRIVWFIVVSLCIAVPVWASGHGPVFGYATPTNSQGEWSFDFGLLERNTAVGSQLTARSIFTYGFTPYMQLSLTTPAIVTDTNLPTTMMTGGDFFESNFAWRFQHDARAIGKRIESTAFGGLVVPGPQRGLGMMSRIARAPGLNAGAVTGLASRSHYFWIGGGYTRFMERGNTRMPSTLSYSLVYGYRPRAMRKDYPFWDWRLFGELTGERGSRLLMGGVPMSGTQAHQVFLGPTTLGIFKTFAISGGVQFPIYRDVGSLLPPERIRVAINVTYFLFQHGQH
jgi:hypothetical protein